MPRLVLVVLVLGLMLAGAPPVAAQTPPDNRARFKTICDFVVSRPIDPIVAPDQPRASHLHDFFGNLGIGASVDTYEELQAFTTSCQDPEDKAAYWVPSVHAKGKKVNPTRAATYYRLGDRSPPIELYPDGLKVIAGWSATTGPSTRAGWRCGGENGYQATPPPTCPGNEWVMVVEFPDCWNGVTKDSPNHRSHMAYSVMGTGSKVCPPSHPVLVPDLAVHAHYVLPAGKKGSDIRLSSGDVSTVHADFFNGWVRARLQSLVNNCLNQVNCS